PIGYMPPADFEAAVSQRAFDNDATHHPQGRIPVESGPADACRGGDHRESYWLPFWQEISARLLDFGQSIGSCHPARFPPSAKRASRRMMSRWWRVGLVDPTAGLSVDRQRLGLDPLSGENRDAGGVGAEVGTVLAHVGIGTRTLNWSTQAIATGESSLDCRRVAPVTVARHRD